MARLLNWPIGIGVTALKLLAGARSVGSVANETVTGYVQTVASAFGLWRWQFDIMWLRGANLRRMRGLATALHGGANAVRYTFTDFDRNLVDSGFSSESAQLSQSWSNGSGWSNGKNWSISPPSVGISAASAAATDIIYLNNEHWANSVDIGDWIGFFPFHFGLYVVTEVVATRQFKIWPPLRKAIDVKQYATLRPTIAMRLESEASALFTRDVDGTKDFSFVMIEVQDADVRDYFAN